MADTASLLNQGLAAHRAGDLGAALAAYRQVLAQDQRCADAIHLIGVIAYQTGDPLTAIDVIGRAIAIDDRNAAYHSNLGEAHRATGALDRAAACYARAIELDPSFLDAHQNLGVVSLALGRPAEAMDAFNRVLAHNRAHPAAWYGLALALEALGRAGEAAEALARCLEADPGHEEARQRLAALPAPQAPAAAGQTAGGATTDGATANEPTEGPSAALPGYLEVTLRDLRAACRETGGGRERLERLVALCDALLQGGKAAPAPVLDALTAERLTDDFILENSILFHLSGDLYYYERLLHLLMDGGDAVPLDVAHYTFWGITRQIFLDRPLPTRVPGFVAHDLPRFYRWIVGEVARRTGVRPRPWPHSRTGGRSEPKRVAIVTNQFLLPMHQPSRDAFDYARLLQDSFGCAVLLVNGNLLPSVPFTAFIPPFAATVTDQLAGHTPVTLEGHTVPVWSSVERSLSDDKIRGLVETIDGFDPDLVVSFGGSVIAADLYAGVRPTLCLPTTSGLTGSLADIVLGYDDGDPTAGLPPEYRAPFAAQFRPFRFGFSAPPQAGGGGRAAFGLPDGAFLFVVVGGRLDHEVDAAFVARLDTLLDLCPGAMVAFAGPVQKLPSLLAAARNAPRLRILGFVPEIRALYRVADAYLNPPRQGGGGSAAYALADGVPVVTLNHGDVAAVAGQGRGVDGMDAFVERAKRLCHDPEFRAAEAAEARRRYAAIDTRHRSVEQLLAYGRELMERRAQG